jgi:hypothetical protein
MDSGSVHHGHERVSDDDSEGGETDEECFAEEEEDFEEERALVKAAKARVGKAVAGVSTTFAAAADSSISQTNTVGTRSGAGAGETSHVSHWMRTASSAPRSQSVTGWTGTRVGTRSGTGTGTAKKTLAAGSPSPALPGLYSNPQTLNPEPQALNLKP